MQLNKDQLEAIKARNTNVVVFASAGAGKTTVLVTRLLERILIDKVPLARILAMTFTEAAASNMKNRLRKRLSEEKTKADADTAYIDAQLAALENSDISTIHSFCLKIVKEYYYLCGISKKSLDNILDSFKSDEIKNEILDDIIKEELSADRSSLMSLSKAISSEMFTFDDLKKTILKIYDKASNKPDPKAWLNTLFKDDIKKIEDIKDHTLYLDDLKKHARDIKEAYFKQMMIDDTIDQKIYHSVIDELDALINTSSYQDFAQKATKALAPLPKRSKCKDEDYRHYNDIIKDSGSTLAKKMVDPKNIIAIENMARPYIDHLLRLTIAFYDRFLAYKKKHHWLDFNDFEHYAYHILTLDDQKIAKKLRKHYKEIMIDEFQDTNEVQYTIAKLISDNDLFVVGDIKQSIYRFRAAKPYLMRSLRDDQSFKVIDIKENYRSKKNLVDFNNRLFDELMNIDDEAFKAHDKQIAPTHDQSQDSATIDFTFYMAEKEKAQKEKNAKADLLANKIIKEYQNGTPFSKMCVLTVTNKDKLNIKRAFESYNIPYFIEDKEGYLSSYAIDCLKAVLDYLSDSDDMIALCAILSSIYGYSDDDLVTFFKDKKLADDIASDLDKLATYLHQNDVVSFFAYLLKINDFYDHLSKNEKANLDYLVDKLKTMSLSSLSNLDDFLASSTQKDSDTAFAQSEDAEVVKVMTIHGSKGLEFDTVFLYSQARFNQKDKTDKILIDDDGIGLRFSVNKYRLTYDTLQKKIIALKEQKEEIREYIRLLYVACTRAKRKLIIVDKIDDLIDYRLDKDHLLASNKGFTSYFMSLAFDDEAIKFTHVDTIDHQALIKDKTKQKASKRLYYTEDQKIKKTTTPSAHRPYLTLELEENKGASFGTMVHKVMEEIDLRHFDRDHILEIVPDIDEKAISHILKIKDDPVFKRALKGQVKRELPFYVRDEDVINGVIDFIAIADDSIILIDYKTDNIKSSNDLIARYRDQLTIYKDVLIKAYQKEVEAYIYSFHLDLMVRVDD